MIIRDSCCEKLILDTANFNQIKSCHSAGFLIGGEGGIASALADFAASLCRPHILPRYACKIGSNPYYISTKIKRPT